MMKKMSFLTGLAMVLVFHLPVDAHEFSFNPDQSDYNCFTILAGRAATEDGSVLFAHNEDDYGKQLVNWIAVPQKQYHEGTELILKNGGRIGEVPFTNRFFWLEIPGMDFSDSYLNEYGVCISSNSCPSREDKPEITDGGIGYRLRGIMAERARTAREAVEIAGDLITRFGYNGSGRTYCIADPTEAWALAVVRGKHWVAQRIPDDHIMIIPNNYTIDQVDLQDPVHFLGSTDLVEYAVSRGWYDPVSRPQFSFREAYAAKGSIQHPGNANRAWGAHYLLNSGYKLGDELPFSLKPSIKLNKQYLMGILRYHYEGTELDKSDHYRKGSPYVLNGTMICGKGTVYGFVAELRKWMPADIGCVMWLAPQWPDIQPFIPWYAGTVQIHAAYCRPGYPESFNDHYHPPADIHQPDAHHAFWSFVRFSDLMNSNYSRKIKSVHKRIIEIEEKLVRLQPKFEAKVLKTYDKNPEEGRMALSRYTSSLAEKTLKRTRKKI